MSADLHLTCQFLLGDDLSSRPPHLDAHPTEFLEFLDGSLFQTTSAIAMFLQKNGLNHTEW